MFLRNISFLILLISIFSCSNKKNIADFNNKEEFLTYLKNLNTDEKQAYLQSQIDQLDSSISYAENYQLHFSISFGASSGDDKNTNWDTVNFDNLDISTNVFTIPNKEIAIKSFDSLKSIFAFAQDYQLPNSKFRTETSSEYFTSEEDTEIKYLGYYKGNQSIDSAKIGLQPIDKIKAQLTYKLVTSYDSLIIHQKSTKPKYRQTEIAINDVSDQEIDLEIPFNVYSAFLDQRGKTPNEKIITSNSYSATPIWGFRIDALAQCQQASLLLKKAQKTPNTMDDQLAKELTKDTFDAIKKITHFEKNISPELDKIVHKKGDDDAIFESIGKIREYVEKNTDYIGPTKMSMSIHFPYPVKEFILYFSNATETLQHEQMYNVIKDFSKPYKVFENVETKKYGIIDSLGNIVIDAEYNDLSASSNNFYYNREDSVGYFFNVKDKKLEPLQDGLRYSESIADLRILYNKKEKIGGLKNNTEVIPFKYYDIKKIGNFIRATYKVRGRDIIDLYTLEGKLLPTETTIRGISDATSNPNNLIVIGNKRLMGVIDIKGKTIIPVEYRDLTSTYSDQYYYVDDFENSFLLTTSNQKIKLPITSGERSFSSHLTGDPLIGYYDAASSAYGYMNYKFQTVIKPQYGSITAFRDGKALVQTNQGNVYLIDQTNKILKTLAEKTGSSIYLERFDNTYYFQIGDNYYDLNGNLDSKITEENK